MGRWGGRILALVLFGILIKVVIISVKKLQNDRTSKSEENYYENIRYLPSVSICFTKREEYPIDEDNTTMIDMELNHTRYL